MKFVEYWLLDGDKVEVRVNPFGAGAPLVLQSMACLRAAVSMGSDIFLLTVPSWAHFPQSHKWGPQGPAPGRHRGDVGDKLGEEQRKLYREAVSMWEVVERRYKLVVCVLKEHLKKACHAQTRTKSQVIFHCF